MNVESKSKLEDLIQPMIQFWERSEDPWMVKDKSSQYVYANPRYLELISMPEGYNIEGRFDGDLPMPQHVFAPVFQSQDRMVEIRKDRVTAVRIYQFNRHTYFQPWFFDKYPLTDREGNCLGTFSHCRPVDSIMVNRLKQIKIAEPLTLTKPTDIFTEREWELVFYIVQAFSSKDIASFLNISAKTVDNALNKIYLKCGVKNRRGLIDYCIEHNCANYVPQSFFQDNK